MVETILASISSWITGFISSTGYIGIIVLMAIESAGIPAPSEIIMPFSGFLVQAGSLNFWAVAAAGSLGNLVGSIIAYWIGLVGGRPFLNKYGKYILISRRDLNRAEGFFRQRGQLTVFFGRLLPMIRTYISFPAGIAKMNVWQFCLYTLIGAFPWSVALTYIGIRLGAHWQEIKAYTQGLDFVVTTMVILGIVYFIYRHVKQSQYD